MSAFKQGEEIKQISVAPVIQYCEFIGDANRAHDEVPKNERLCEYAGFTRCVLHEEPLIESEEGWRICCEECTTPFYITENTSREE